MRRRGPILLISTTLVALALGAAFATTNYVTAVNGKIFVGAGGSIVPAKLSAPPVVDPYADELIDLWYRGITNEAGEWVNVITGGLDMVNQPTVGSGAQPVTAGYSYPAWDFDGVDDAFTTGSNTIYGTITSGVWMAWVKYDAPAVSERFTLFGASKTNLSPPGVAWFLCEVYNPAGTPQWVIRAGKASTTYWSFSAPAGTSISTNTWQLVAMANNGNRTRLFVDNVFLGTATSGAGPIPNTAWFALLFSDHFLSTEHFCDSVHVGMYKNSAGNTFFHPRCEVSQVRNYGNVYFTNFTWYITNTNPTNDLETTFN